MKIKLVKTTLLTLILVFLIGCYPTQTTELVGTWKDIETEEFHLQFSDFYFAEYYYEQEVGRGEYRASWGELTLNYTDNCGPGTGIDCQAKLRYEVNGDVLVITDSEGEIVFRRVK